MGMFDLLSLVSGFGYAAVFGCEGVMFWGLKRRRVEERLESQSFL